MALSEGLKGFVNFFTKSFNDGSDDEAFMDLVDRDGDYDTDGTLALDTMYGTRVNNKPERSFERESKVISHPNSYKSAHALNGTAQKISDMVFIFTPSNVSLSVENGALQSKFAESLWNKPL